MKMKHTPAPWLYQPGRDSRPPYVIRGSEGGFVVVGMTADRQEADAALIAAAPELLAALEIAEKFCGSLTSDECPDSVHIPIREAIAKAKGEQR